ncbi:MAG: hypothetical protein A2622_06780 [Bdellovibrionales bacterium RIFCSPHIGHO2_01_FULL_40_29]|nr:MAG: hypothetical protein A2622_06780 [Bdellovibrionales bacterium RIFCSPHIGHO2_01_FULL_40_29]OFZ35145.1 MAG: hypothetical protein A3D17_07130 [Bdellovibrionales bacterium RIFCSPHIGHO2_02_FULL_40_15]
MTLQNPKIGKKGAPAKIAEKANRLRRQPLSKKIFEIVDENYKNNLNKEPLKRSAKSDQDMDL